MELDTKAKAGKGTKKSGVGAACTTGSTKAEAPYDVMVQNYDL